MNDKLTKSEINLIKESIRLYEKSKLSGNRNFYEEDLINSIKRKLEELIKEIDYFDE
jgi:hypothetical protein